MEKISCPVNVDVNSRNCKTNVARVNSNVNKTFNKGRNLVFVYVSLNEYTKAKKIDTNHHEIRNNIRTNNLCIIIILRESCCENTFAKNKCRHKQKSIILFER